jgi:hypothetical protein
MINEGKLAFFKSRRLHSNIILFVFVFVFGAIWDILDVSYPNMLKQMQTQHGIDSYRGSTLSQISREKLRYLPRTSWRDKTLPELHGKTVENCCAAYQYDYVSKLNIVFGRCMFNKKSSKSIKHMPSIHTVNNVRIVDHG